MMTKLEIKVPHEEPVIHEFDSQDIDLGEDILYMAYNDHLYNAFDDYVDEVDGMVELMGVEYSASELLKVYDEIAYECHFSDWMSYTMEYANEEIETYGYVAIGDIEINLIVDSEEEEE